MSKLARFRPYRPAKLRQLSAVETGRLRVYARPAGSRTMLDVTWIRGAQTQIGTFSFTDPYGPEQLTLTFPAVTLFDALGQGELAWCAHHMDIDVIYDGPMPAGYPWKGWRWEGYAVSFDRSSGAGLTVACVGALRQLDNYLAKPTYPTRPLPYEHAIREQFRAKPDLRVSVPAVEWPAWWNTHYGAPAAKTPSYLIPVAVKTGDPWSGLLTRNTGTWQPALTGYVASLLGAMYSERGRWTLDLDPYRRTVLRHRVFTDGLAPDVVVVHPGAPGVSMQLSVDWSQSLNVVYGQGTALNGVTYSGMTVSTDGRRTSYTPLASMRQVHPITDKNGWLQQHRMRKEVNLELQQGLDLIDAQKVALMHLARFADPGITGTITLESDPRLGSMNGAVCPRHLLRAGMSVWVPHLFGDPAGTFFHVVSSSGDLSSGQVTLTVDTKYRDALTLDEVRLRGRDSLSIVRMLKDDAYKPVVDDMLVPWSYAEGSGFIPSGKEFSAVPLFKGMPDDVTFPWSSWTRTHPPERAGKPSPWAKCYIRIGPADDSVADNNWAHLKDKAGAGIGIPVRMAQAAQIRLIQLAAYDKSGNVMKVPFHVGLYYQNGVKASAMPQIPAGYKVAGKKYKAGQHYPFFTNAFQTFNLDGTQIGTDIPGVKTETPEIARWGDWAERAGFYPGSDAVDDPATGLLVDETRFSFTALTAGDQAIDPFSVTQKSQFGGYLYIMIYCDAQGDQPVYFLGRMFRVEPGTAS